MPCLIKKFRENKKLKLFEQQPHTQQQLLQQQKQEQHAQRSSRSAGKWRMKLLIMFVISGILGSIWLFWHINEGIVFKRKETLTSMCDERARMLQDQFNVSMNHVHALAILVSTFHHGKQPTAIDQVMVTSLPITYSPFGFNKPFMILHNQKSCAILVVYTALFCCGSDFEFLFCPQKTFGEYTKTTAFERPLTTGVNYALGALYSEREQ